MGLIKKYLWTAHNNPHAAFIMGFHLLRRKIPLEYYSSSNYSYCPDFITILITKRCNFKCDRCSSQSPQYTSLFNQSGQEELTTAEVKELIDSVSRFKPAIYFCGGEPTLRPDLFELIRYVKKKKMVTGFTTNGSTMDEEMCQEIIDTRLDFFSVSIDGPEDYHDRVRGVNGAFKNVTNGLRLLIKLKGEQNKTSPHIRIASIVDIENISNSKFILDLAKEIEVDEVAFGALMFYTEEAEKQQKRFQEEHDTGGDIMIGLPIDENHHFDMDMDEVQQFLDDTKKWSKTTTTFVPNDLDFENYYNVEKNPSKASRCLTPWFSATIMPNGDVVPCQEYVVGNIREEKLLDVWNNEKMRHFRRFRKKGPMPACYRCNEGQEIKFGR